MKSRIVLVLAAIVLLAGAGRVLAHHSFTATYDSTKRIELEGVVKQLLWRNPHSFLRIDVTGKDGVTETWSLEWGSVQQLSQTKITRTTIRLGDRVKVAGEPARDPSSQRMLLQYMQRPSDGFVWEGRVD